MDDKKTGRPIMTLEARTAEITAEWRRQGEDRRHWPLAPLGLAAIGLAEAAKFAQRRFDALSYWLDEGEHSPIRALWLFGRSVWPLCPFCGYPILTTIERHECR